MFPSVNCIVLAVIEILPVASFTPTILSTSFTNVAIVSGCKVHPVLLGTLYIIIGQSTLFATSV